MIRRCRTGTTSSEPLAAVPPPASATPSTTSISADARPRLPLPPHAVRQSEGGQHRSRTSPRCEPHVKHRPRRSIARRIVGAITAGPSITAVQFSQSPPNDQPTKARQLTQIDSNHIASTSLPPARQPPSASSTRIRLLWTTPERQHISASKATRTPLQDRKTTPSDLILSPLTHLADQRNMQACRRITLRKHHCCYCSQLVDANLWQVV